MPVLYRWRYLLCNLTIFWYTLDTEETCGKRTCTESDNSQIKAYLRARSGQICI